MQRDTEEGGWMTEDDWCKGMTTTFRHDDRQASRKPHGQQGQHEQAFCVGFCMHVNE